MRYGKVCEFSKFDAATGIAWGWAIVCTKGGKPYVDLQGDHIPEDAMVKAADDFMKSSRVGLDMHSGDQVADVPFAFPVTKDNRGPLGISDDITGLMIGYRPHDEALLTKLRNGERTGFSIGGWLDDADVVDDIGKRNTLVTNEKRSWRTEYAKRAIEGVLGKAVRVFRTFKLREISAVDLPAQEHAKVALVKSAHAMRVAPSILVVKSDSLLTSEDAGHQHVVDLDQVDDDGVGSTSYASMNTDDYGHCHSFLKDPQTGKWTISANEGHTHTIDEKDVAAVTMTPDTGVPVAGADKIQMRAPFATVRSALAELLGKKSPKDDKLKSVLEDHIASLDEEGLDDLGVHADAMNNCPEKSATVETTKSRFSRLSDKLGAQGADDPDALAAYIGRQKYGAKEFNSMAAAGKSKKRAPTVIDKLTDRGTGASVDLMDPKDVEIASLKKQLFVMSSLVAMSDVHKAHAQTLTGDAQEAFVKMSIVDRDHVIVAKRGVEVYKSERLNRTFYSTDDQTMVQIARDADELYKANGQALAERDLAKYAKAASDTIPMFSEAANVHAAIMKAIDTIPDAPIREAAIKSLRGANGALAARSTFIGVSPLLEKDGSTSVVLDGAEKELRDAVTAYGKAHNIADYNVAFTKATATDPATRTAYDKVQNERFIAKRSKGNAVQP